MGGTPSAHFIPHGYKIVRHPGLYTMHAVRRICEEKPHRGVSEIEGRRVGIKRNDVKTNVLYTVNSASRVEHSCFAANINNTVIP